jgi:hypothetical protein
LGRNVVALFRLDCGGVRIEVWEVDHGPPHCHIGGLERRGTVVVNLLTLEVSKPAGLRLSPVVSRCLRENQAAMLAAWEKVISYPERQDG